MRLLPRIRLIRVLAVVALALWVSEPTRALPPPQVSANGAELPSPNLAFADLDLSVDNLAEDLDTPWDLVWGPDDWIWFTERRGTVSRVHPQSGRLERLANIDGVYEAGESGLMGMEFHPEFLDNGLVYLVHSYRTDNDIRNRLIRVRFDGSRLVDPEVLVENIDGNTYHDGARLELGPDGYLYLTTGDAGRARRAQDVDSLNGKILRLTLDGRAADGNPFESRVFSYGHRNAQGLVFHEETGELFITEHGPNDNDEVARVRVGENHGWPFVRGFCDGDVRGEQRFCAENDVAEPLAAWTPTIAPAGAAFYYSSRIPSLEDNLLFTTLAGESLVALEFDADYDRVIRQRVLAEGSYGRLRDVLVGPDGSIYVATSNRDGRGRPAPEDDRILQIRARQ